MFKRTIAALLLLATSFAKTPRPVSPVGINMGDGKKQFLSSYKGKVVLFAIMSTSCEHCISSLTLLDKLQKAYGPQGFQAFAAIGDENAPFMLVPFKQRYKPSFPVGYLNREEMQKVGDIPLDKRPFVPIFLFIDRTGTVRFQYYGDDPFMNDEERATTAIVQNLLR
jgi:thiol-disulfide isomerase/thioredoxin